MPIFSDFFKGISRSKYDQQGFDSTTNIDVHTELGTATNQFALASESTTPNEACISVDDTGGDTYFFSTTSGKTWKRTAAGSYSLVNTNANGAHTGAAYFRGFIYYAAGTKLGTFDLSSTWSDSAQTFTQTPSTRPMYELNNSLFIGNGSYVASVDSTGNFLDNSLDLPSQYEITALTGSGTDLLIGTLIGTNVQKCKVYLWDTYSPSWVVEDSVPEIGINCFINADNYIFAQCGTAGQIYYWTGQKMSKFKKIRGVTTSVNPYNSTVLSGRPLFAVGDDIYSIHREGEEYPWAITHEYTATQGTIKSILAVGSQLLVSNGSNIDNIGSNYATAVLDTPLVSGRVQRVIVHYDSIGTGASIGISTSTDGAAYSAQTVTTDSVRKLAYFDGGLGSSNFVQARITLTPATTNKVTIRGIEIQ